MKILWVNLNFLHPTTKGGQIRTLEMLRQLHRQHEIHYVAYEDPAHPEGVTRSSEYCTRAYPVRRQIPPKRSLKFVGEVLGSLFAPLPLTISRFASAELTAQIASLRQQERFDVLVCDFLHPAPCVGDIREWVVFQHNVETMIWRRRVEHARNPLERAYLRVQAERMFAYEQSVCQQAAYVIAVSEADARTMRELFGIAKVGSVPTGVDTEYFAPPGDVSPVSDLVFIGSMDWMPNVDGVQYFVREVLPLIRQRRPDCSLTITGRTPPPEVLALAHQDSRIRVTGTVPDVRPYLWGSLVSVVPLRIGGGTRLKIYEAMAARVPVVSTTIGAEGLQVHPPRDIRIADTPQEFAEQCLALLENPAMRQQTAEAGWQLVNSTCSWSQVTRIFAGYLEHGLRLRPKVATAHD